MKKILVFLALVCQAEILFAQQPYVYTIKADSVKQNKKIEKQNEELVELKRLNNEMESLKQQLNELRTLINNRNTSGNSK